MRQRGRINILHVQAMQAGVQAKQFDDSRNVAVTILTVKLGMDFGFA